MSEGAPHSPSVPPDGHRFVIRTAQNRTQSRSSRPQKLSLGSRKSPVLQICPLLIFALQKIYVPYYFVAVFLKLQKIISCHFLTFLVLICSHFHKQLNRLSFPFKNKQKTTKNLVLVEMHSPKTNTITLKYKLVCLGAFNLLHCLNLLKRLHHNVSCNLASDQHLNII